MEQSTTLTIKEISTDEAVKAWQGREAIFIDVCATEEQGHVPGAILIPLDELVSKRNEIPKDKKVLLICRSGMAELRHFI